MYQILTTTTSCPVELYDVKEHLRIDHTDDDYYLAQLMHAAILYAEHQMNRTIRKSTASGILINAKGCVFLPFGNTHVTDIYSNGVDLTPGVDYYSGAERIVFLREYKNVLINFTCGYEQKDVPADINHALLMIIGTMYESRQDVTQGFQSFKAPFSSSALLKHYKIW